MCVQRRRSGREGRPASLARGNRLAIRSRWSSVRLWSRSIRIGSVMVTNGALQSSKFTPRSDSCTSTSVSRSSARWVSVTGPRSGLSAGSLISRLQSAASTADHAWASIRLCNAKELTTSRDPSLSSGRRVPGRCRVDLPGSTRLTGPTTLRRSSCARPQLRSEGGRRSSGDSKREVHSGR